MNRIVLKLFVNDHTPHSVRAVAALRQLAAANPTLDIEIVDVVEDPARAEEEGIMATPTLVRTGPAPTLRVIGDLSHVDEGLLMRLELAPEEGD